MIVSGARKLQPTTLLDVDAQELAQHRVVAANANSAARRLVGSGMALPDTVLRKLYYKNALALVPGLSTDGFAE